jgi:tetratricopeptide (TPR) repeat protein
LSWLGDVPWFPNERTAQPLNNLRLRRGLSAEDIISIRRQIGTGLIPPSEGAGLGSEMPSHSPLSSNAQVERALLLHHIGLVGYARGLRDHYAQEPRPMRADMQFIFGDDIQASRTTLDVLINQSVNDVSALWLGACAVYGRNDAALEQLRHAPMVNPMVFGLYLRALAAQGKFEEIDQRIGEAAEQRQWPSWLRARVEAELRMESLSEIGRAQRMLEQLGKQSDLPPVHLADVLYNLGVSCDWLGQAVNARTAYRRAIQVNPHLEPAKERLQALG